MAGNEVTLTTTSDNEQQVRQALGLPEPKPGKAAPKAAAAAVAEPEVEPETTEVEAEAEAEAEEPAAPRPKRRGNDPEERIGRLTWEKNNLITEIERRDARIAELTARGGKPAEAEEEEPVPQFSKPAPKLEDAESIEEWMQAHSDWAIEKAEFNVDQKLTKREQKQTQTQAQTRAEQEQEAVMTAHLARIEAYSKTDPEFVELAQEAMETKLPISPIMLAHVTHSEFGPQILKHLAKNPKEAHRLSRMNQGPCLVALGKIERNIELEAEAEADAEGAPGTEIQDEVIAAPTRPRPLSARKPAPTTPIKPLGGGAKATKSPGEMTMAEYKAWRAAGGGRR